MRTRHLILLALGCAVLTACGTLPPVDVTLPDDETLLDHPFPDELRAPLVEHPPVEPVEPIEPVEPPAPPPATPPAPAPIVPPTKLPSPVPVPAPTTPPVTGPAAPGSMAAPVTTPAPGGPPAEPVVAPAAPALAPEPTDDQIVGALVGDLARFAVMPPEDIRKELNAVTQALGRARTDANRIRLAMLYTLTRAPQDDQRALQLLENVSRSTPGSPAMKHLAGVLQIQVVERIRAVREEQQKADTAIQKLEALRALERNLLRDRVRSGGGGGAGGGSGSGGGSGGR